MRRAIALFIPIAALAALPASASATAITVDETATGNAFLGEGVIELEGTATGTPVANGEFFASYEQVSEERASDRCGFTFRVRGTATITGRAGAQLVKDEVGTVCEATNTITGTWTANPDESTGRFVGASGTGNFRVRLTFGDGDTFTSTETGTIFPIKGGGTLG